jgi:hypothetical protein
MKINITNKQYNNLLIMSGIANCVLGYIGDMLEEPDYVPQSKEMEGLQDYLVSFAKDFGYEGLTEDFEGKKVLADNTNDKLIWPIINDYDECILSDHLANKLAWRDFRKDHSDAEIKKMGGKTGYSGVELYDYEKKYWDEFEKHNFDRLEIK